jgi:hypothetical protein
MADFRLSDRFLAVKLLMVAISEKSTASCGWIIPLKDEEVS